MIKIHTFLALILFSNILALSQKEDPSHIIAILEQNKQQDAIKNQEPITITPLHVPDQNYIQKHDNLAGSKHQNEPQKSHPEKVIKPAGWLLEASLDNAPTLLKGIFTYLQSRLRKNSSEYSVTIPSFHRFILVGPPGSGKTTLAHAIAHMLGYSVIFIPATSFLGRYRNQTSINITQFLREKAATQHNVVIIIDELHKLFEHHNDEQSEDSQVAAAFWLTLDDIEKYNPNIIIIGTANSVAKLPPEIKSRFSGKIITLPLPDKTQRLHAFKNSISHDKSIVLSSSIDDIFIVEMLEKIHNCSLRDVQLIIDTTKMFYYAEKSMHENNFPLILTKKHFEQALKQLQSEAQILEEGHIDKLYKRLRPWGLIFSVAVNISILTKASSELYNKILAFC